MIGFILAAALQTATITLNITGDVPPICKVSESQIVCNVPYNYFLYVLQSDGTMRLIEQGRGPVLKPIAYQLAAGESFVIFAAQ